MEHVSDVGLVLERVHAALKHGASYRFICPNYAFPYEPHFNMPTLGNKVLTGWIMRRRIENSLEIQDPDGTWNSLNWISVARVKRVCRKRMGIDVCFDAKIFECYLDRALHDPLFQARRGGLLSKILQVLHTIGVLKLMRIIPLRWLPIMDCTLMKEDA